MLLRCYSLQESPVEEDKTPQTRVCFRYSGPNGNAFTFDLVVAKTDAAAYSVGNDYELAIDAAT